jgi:hypothetical protein
MASTMQNQLVANIAYDLVAQASPQELPLFTVTSEAYFKNPGQVRKNQEGKDESLGFGAGALVALSPIIISIVDQVLKYIVSELIPQEIKESGVIGKIFKRKQTAPVPLTLPLVLTPEQMRRIHAQAVQSARQFNLSDTQADQLATSLVGRLALSNQ